MNPVAWGARGQALPLTPFKRAMAEIQWWYARGEQQLGPVVAAELRRLATSGELLPSDLVWREGLPEWTPAARLKGLFSEVQLREAATREPAPVPAIPGEVLAAPPEPAAKETAEMAIDAVPESSYGSFVVGEPTAPISPADILPDAPTPTPQRGPVAAPPAAPVTPERPRMSISHLTLVLTLVQGVLWGICVLVILLGGLLFTSARLRAKTPAEEAAAAAVFATFFIGGYVVARAGEKIAGLVQQFAERRSRS